MHDDPIFVALIHGTWAKNSAWPNEGSAFRRSLENELRRPVKAYVKQWSGRNWDTDRDTTAAELVYELRDFWKNAPKRDRFLVCHSHGGNIGIRAAAKMEEDLGGVVCLNTPFISVIRRNVVWRWATLGAVLMVAMLGFLAAWIPSVVERDGGAIFQEIFFLALGVVAVSLFGGMFGVLGRCVRERAQNFVKEVTPARIRSCPVLCVASAGDEATYGLGLLEMLVNLPVFLQHILILPVLVGVAVGIQFFGWVPSVKIGGADTGMWASAWVYLIVLFVALQIIGFGSTLLLRAVVLGLGFKNLLGNLAVRVVVTPVPLHVRTVDFVDVDTGGGALLAHSRIYEDPEATQEVATWMANGGRLAGDGSIG